MVKSRIFRFSTIACFLSLLLIPFISCNKNNRLNLPEDFSSYSDSAKVDWLLNNHKPAMVAEVLCEEGAGMDSSLNFKDFRATVNVIYNLYDETQKKEFGTSMNDYAASLPNKEKMRLYVAGSGFNGYNLGYAYGVDFLNQADESNIGEIQEDYEALKEIYPDNSQLTNNFIKGLNAALAKQGKSWQPNK
ncbi:MAG: hypothetical protein J1E82_08800 [Muribaculaceae bacterium]|nr:hypothetical protein [Muribaculaceae bacterium]